MSCTQGFTLLELVFALGLAAMMATITVPYVLAGVDNARARAAARYLAGRFALARALAVSRGTNVGVRFETVGDSVIVAAYADGDEDGVRTADIESGVDRALERPVRLADLFPAVTCTLVLGAGDIMAFTPTGTSSSGTVSIRGREGSQYAVRVFGPTARTRVLRFDSRRQEFVEIY